MEESWTEERKNFSFQEIAGGVITLDTSHPKSRKYILQDGKEGNRQNDNLLLTTKDGGHSVRRRKG